jgi:hypothetical protein
MPKRVSYVTADAQCMPEPLSIRPVPVYIPPVVKDGRNARGKAGTGDMGPTAPEEIDRRVLQSSPQLRPLSFEICSGIGGTDSICRSPFFAKMVNQASSEMIVSTPIPAAKSGERNRLLRSDVWKGHSFSRN